MLKIELNRHINILEDQFKSSLNSLNKQPIWSLNEVEDEWTEYFYYMMNDQYYPIFMAVRNAKD